MRWIVLNAKDNTTWAKKQRQKWRKIAIPRERACETGANGVGDGRWMRKIRRLHEKHGWAFKRMRLNSLFDYSICNMFAFIFIYIFKRSHFIFSDPSGLNSVDFVSLDTFFCSLCVFSHFLCPTHSLYTIGVFFNLLYWCYLCWVFFCSVDFFFPLALAMMPSMVVNCVGDILATFSSANSFFRWKLQRYT